VVVRRAGLGFLLPWTEFGEGRRDGGEQALACRREGGQLTGVGATGLGVRGDLAHFDVVEGHGAGDG
jgi:hypothetical protein